MFLVMRDTDVMAQVSQAADKLAEVAHDSVVHESPWHDYCRVLLHRLETWKPEGATSFLVGVTSCASGAGVTSLVSHLGSTTAQDTDLSVLLIDAHLDNPLLDKLFSVPAAPGLTDLLLRGALPRDAMRETKVERLKVLPAGRLEGSSARAYASMNLQAVLEAFRSDYDLVLVDLPPLDASAAATRVAGLLDGVVLIVEAERDVTDAAQQAQELLIQAQARLLGVVLNKRSTSTPQ